MIGIVILNYKNYQETISCVENIRETNQSLNYKIYIVDNCSPNESCEILSEKFNNSKDICLLQSDKNGGFSYGNNFGFKAAVSDGCELILCTNSDVEFNENSIPNMVKAIEESENCAVVGPKVYCGDGTVQNANKGILTAKVFVMHHKPFLWFDWLGTDKKYTYAGYKYDKPIQITGMVSGCCFLIRSAVLEEIGYLDENVFLYHEEDILGAKLREKGYCVILDPSAEIVHFGGKSTPSDYAFVRYHKLYSGLYYLWNYVGTSKCGFAFVGLVVKTMFFAKSIFNKAYRKYYKKLMFDIKNLKKSKRVFWKK